MTREEAERVERTYARYRDDPARAAAWRRDNAGNVAAREQLVARALAALGDPGAVGPLLDIGAGTGWWLRAVADNGFPAAALRGLDIQAARVEAARAAAPAIAWDEGDALSLPYPDGSFAAATLFLALSSLRDAEAQRRALAEAARVVAPGGRILIWDHRVPNPANCSTSRVAWRQVRAVLGPPVHAEAITLLPPLARRLGRATPVLYPALCALPVLNTHRLALHRRK